jgi:RNA polymerase sigma-70 factor (ECF subfamily)
MVLKRRSTKAPSTHATLLVKLRGDASAEAWQTFVDLYAPLVYGFCRSRGLQDADARDVTQQVLTSVHLAIRRFVYDPAKGKFRNWLGVATVHEMARHERRARRAGKGQGDGGADVLAELIEATADSEWIEEFNSYIFKLAIDRVRPHFDADVWQAFELTWIQDIKPRIAAEQLGKPSAWVYKARYKVMERLRGEIEFLTSDSAALQKPS